MSHSLASIREFRGKHCEFAGQKGVVYMHGGAGGAGAAVELGPGLSLTADLRNGFPIAEPQLRAYHLWDTVSTGFADEVLSGSLLAEPQQRTAKQSGLMAAGRQPLAVAIFNIFDTCSAGFGAELLGGELHAASQQPALEPRATPVVLDSCTRSFGRLRRGTATGGAPPALYKAPSVLLLTPSTARGAARRTRPPVVAGECGAAEWGLVEGWGACMSPLGPSHADRTMGTDACAADLIADFAAEYLSGTWAAEPQLRTFYIYLWDIVIIGICGTWSAGRGDEWPGGGLQAASQQPARAPRTTLAGQLHRRLRYRAKWIEDYWLEAASLLPLGHVSFRLRCRISPPCSAPAAHRGRWHHAGHHEADDADDAEDACSEAHDEPLACKQSRIHGQTLRICGAKIFEDY